jgi:hypothetical protein
VVNYRSTNKEKMSGTADTSNKKGDTLVKKKVTGGGVTGAYRSELGIDELRGYIFIYGSKMQAEKYLRTKKAIGEFVGTKYGKAMWSLVEKKQETTFKDPDEPDKDAKRAEVKKYKMLLKMRIEDKKKYQEDKSKVFRLIMGQCTTTMRNRIEASRDYEKLEEDDDVIGLLESIRELVYSNEATQYQYWAMQSAIRKLCAMKQESKESLSGFIKWFEAQVEATEDMCVGRCYHRGLVC